MAADSASGRIAIGYVIYIMPAAAGNGAAKWNMARRTASAAAPAKALERPPHHRTKPIAARAGKGVASG